VTGDEGDVAGQIEAALGLQHPQHRDAGGHQGRLGVRREGQLLGRALEHQAREVLAQRLVDLGEDRAGGGMTFSEGGAHADGLAALARKDEGARHVRGASCP
jgi:hypothetical protein